MTILLNNYMFVDYGNFLPNGGIYSDMKSYKHTSGIIIYKINTKIIKSKLNDKYQQCMM